MSTQKTIERSVAFLTLGCKVNSYETNAMEKLFSQKGYEIKSFSEKAQIYVINTCTVTNMADRKSRQMIHKAKKMNPDGIVVAVGCYVQAAREELETDEGIDVIIGNNQKSQIVSILEDYLVGEVYGDGIINMDEADCFEELSIESSGEQTRAYIKIQDGCNQFCSYCIIPYVRGRIRSRSECSVIDEVKRLGKNGFKEVVLTGIHLSSYGVDLLEDMDFVKAGGRPLLNLIRKISEVEGIDRIRLGSLEPRIITEEFVSGLSGISEFCPHFHLSLQSGCDEVLKRMNRKYNSKEYLEKCHIIRKFFDKPAITTDVIVGFPGETEEEFQQTKLFLKKVQFSDMHIFKYSKRKGTQAANRQDQVADNEKNRRSEILIQLSHTMSQLYKRSLIGEQQFILVEEKIQIDGKAYWIGHNERYIKIGILADSTDQSKSNEILKVTLKEELNKDILLAILDSLY